VAEGGGSDPAARLFSMDVKIRRHVQDNGKPETRWVETWRISDIRAGREIMSAAIINLIIQLIAGAAGGNAAGAALKDYDLGKLGNTIAGAVGGVGGGQILQALIPMLAGAAGGGVDLGAIVGQAVGGGVAGAILTFIVGLVKNMMAGQAAR